MSQNLFSRFQANAAFENAIQLLNPKQKQAVEATEGPVMVIAGPGTGKTQLLAARIGNILLKGLADFHNILCLTYTDAGSVAMRKRLIDFIGPEAYNIHIYTFHSFCNQVIKENIEYFGGYRELQLISDLELDDLIKKIIDDFDDEHPLKRYKGEIYFNKSRIIDLFTNMKRENWTAKDIENAYTKLKEEVYNDPKYIYKRDGKFGKKGELKIKDIEKVLKPIQKTVAAAGEFDKYNELLEVDGRMDYNDMILKVISAFKDHPGLLASYQERFQYILVDEYQDTNGSQNEILLLLSNHWGKEANIFVVGDDDQSIFRFQGASMQNIEIYEDHFKPNIIVLEDNYRSTQNILTAASELVSNNAERLVNRRQDLTKNLIAKGQYQALDNPPIILSFPYVNHEEKWVINKILELQKQGTRLQEIAIIYPKHKNIEDIRKYLALNNIPYNLKRKIDVLKEPEVKKILNILNYIHAEYKRNNSGEDLIFEILHYDYFGLSAKDIGLLSIHCSRRTDDQHDDIRWRDILTDKEAITEAGLANPEEVIRVGNLFEEWISNVANLTIQILFEKVLTEGGIINTIMLDGENKAWRLQLINSLFNFIKSESAKDPALDLASCQSMIDQMNESNISLPLNRIYFAKEGINLITAHSSKGLEFQHVFMIKTNQKNWVRKNHNMNFSYPKSLVPNSAQSDIEDDRRLFYVAMTRAKSHLYLTSAKKNNEDKDIEVVSFVHEMMKDSDLKIVDVHLEEEDIIEYTTSLMKFKKGSAELIDHELINRVLEGYSMSVTSLSKYLKCPLTFYFENILRVPMGRNASMGFGNAVHYALEKFFLAIEKRPDRTIGTKDELIDYFKNGIKKFASHFTAKEYELRITYGEKILTGYYEHHKSSWTSQKSFKPEYSPPPLQYKGVPITGKLDRVDVYDDRVVVVDYKTGGYKKGKDKLKPPAGDDDHGQDYWRQLVFYKMLLDSDKSKNYNMREGVMDFVEPVDEIYKSERRDIEQFEIDLVENQLIDSYKKIMNHEFEKGCNDEKCKWCDFVNSNFSLNAEIPAYVEDEEVY